MFIFTIFTFFIISFIFSLVYLVYISQFTNVTGHTSILSRSFLIKKADLIFYKLVSTCNHTRYSTLQMVITFVWIFLFPILLLITTPYFIYLLLQYKKYKHTFNYNWLLEKGLLTDNNLTEDCKIWLNDNRVQYRFCSTYRYLAVSKKDILVFRLWA